MTEYIDRSRRRCGVERLLLNSRKLAWWIGIPGVLLVLAVMAFAFDDNVFVVQFDLDVIGVNPSGGSGNVISVIFFVHIQNQVAVSVFVC